MVLPISGPDIFPHVRLVLGMVLSLSIARLLSGAARFVQHPDQRVYPAHLGWALFMLLYLIHFWWWEYRLAALPEWTFAIFFFVVSYSILLYLLCTLLFPDDLKEYGGYEDYFFSRRKWFFGLLALTFVFDIVDTWIKGDKHFSALTIEYPIRNALFVLACLVAIWSENRRFHAGLIVVVLVYQASFILRLFNTFTPT